MLKPSPRVPRFACLHCSTFRPLAESVIVKIKYLIRNGATETEIDEFRLSRRKKIIQHWNIPLRKYETLR